jgi:hypothetical protein
MDYQKINENKIISSIPIAIRIERVMMKCADE